MQSPGIFLPPIGPALPRAAARPLHRFATLAASVAASALSLCLMDGRGPRPRCALLPRCCCLAAVNRPAAPVGRLGSSVSRAMHRGNGRAFAPLRHAPCSRHGPRHLLGLRPYLRPPRRVCRAIRGRSSAAPPRAPPARPRPRRGPRLLRLLAPPPSGCGPLGPSPPGRWGGGPFAALPSHWLRSPLPVRACSRPRLSLRSAGLGNVRLRARPAAGAAQVTASPVHGPLACSSARCYGLPMGGLPALRARLHARCTRASAVGALHPGDASIDRPQSAVPGRSTAPSPSPPVL